MAFFVQDRLPAGQDSLMSVIQKDTYPNIFDINHIRYNSQHRNILYSDY